MTDLRKVAEDAIRLGAEATKRPWKLSQKVPLENGNRFIQDHRSGRVARLWNGRTCRDENADFIVHAANNIEALARDWLLLDEVAKMAKDLVAHMERENEWSVYMVDVRTALEALRKHRTPAPKERT